jgi:hypothetical protein
MTLFEGLMLGNSLVLLWVTYTMGKLKIDIETLYQGLAAVMGDLD